jgi:hypothetical protein
MISKLTTNYGEPLKIGQTVYAVTLERGRPLELQFEEIKIEKLDDRRISTSKKDDIFWIAKWNDIVVSGMYTIQSVVVFGDAVDTHREFLLAKRRFGKLIGPGHFQEKGSRIFYTDKEKAIEVFKKKYRNNFIGNRKFIPKIFTGTGHEYGSGKEFVGYRYYQYHLPK